MLFYFVFCFVLGERRRRRKVSCWACSVMAGGGREEGACLNHLMGLLCYVAEGRKMLDSRIRITLMETSLTSKPILQIPRDWEGWSHEFEACGEGERTPSCMHGAA